MVVAVFAQSQSPGNEQRDFWSSEAADQEGSNNMIGIKNQAVDALVDAIYRVRDGGLVVAPALASAVVQDLGGGEARGEAPGTLTRRHP